MRVIGDDGKQHGVISKQEALKLAEEKGTDLVLVAPNANPPVAKLIDFSKFKFQQEKKEQSAKKKAHTQELKEFRLTPFMAENDLNVRIERSRAFLKRGDKVRFVVWFRGRQLAHKQFGYDILKKAVEKLNDVAVIEIEPKFRGRNLEISLKPSKTYGQKTQNQVQSQGPVPSHQNRKNPPAVSK